MLTIKDVIIKDFSKISLFENVREASQKIRKAPGECLLAFDKNKFYGVITPNELSGQDFNRLIADIPIKRVKSIPTSLSIEKVYQSFKKLGFDGLPVARNGKDIIGILLKDDLWSAIIKELKAFNKALKERYSELEVLKNLVQELGASLKTTVVLQKLIAALKQTLPKSVNFAYVVPSPDPGRPSNLLYIHARNALGKEYLNAVKENMTFGFDMVPTRIKNREDLVRWIRGNFRFEFVEGTVSKDSREMPLSFFNVPLAVKDEILGVVNISSPESHLFSKKDIDLANTMVGATASTISRLKQLLETEHSRIEALVESMTNGVILFDTDQRVTLSNPAAQKMTGLPREGFYLSEFIKLFKPATATADIDLEEEAARILKGGKSVFIEELNISRFAYELFITPVLGYEKNIIGGAIILHDITHHKEIDEMKDEFLSIASHELRTPMTAIMGNIDMVLKGQAGEISDEVKEYLEDVATASDRLIKLVNDMLDVSRIEAGRMKFRTKAINIAELIRLVVKDFQTFAKAKNIIFSYKSKGKLPSIFADPDKVVQVLDNIIGNALKFTFKGSIIITTELQQDMVIVHVKDTGIGISKEDKEKLFKKFQQLDTSMVRETKGTGLGLYVSTQIVKKLGGEIWMESEGMGKGSTFSFSLPMVGNKKAWEVKKFIEMEAREHTDQK